MNNNTNLEKKYKVLEEKCKRLEKINEALMNRVEHCTDDGGSSFALFESNLLLHRQIKEHTSRLEAINQDLQNQIIIRKKTQEALKRERDFIAAVLDNAAVMVVILDQKGVIVKINRTTENIIGHSIDEIIGKKLNDVFLKTDDFQNVESILNTVFESNSPYSWESKWKTGDNENKTFSWSTTVLRDEYGAVEYIISSGIDITERKIEEERRLLVEQRYKNLVEYLPQTVYERDSKGNFTFFNSNGLREFGYTHKDLEKGLHIKDIVANIDHKKLLLKIAQNKGSKVTSEEFCMQRKNGSTFPALIYSFPIDSLKSFTKRRGIVFDISKLRKAEKQLEKYRNHLENIVQQRTSELSSTIEKLNNEVTERKRIESALRASEQNYRELVQNANSIILRVNQDGIITFFNEFAQFFFGYSEEDIVGKSVEGIISLQQESDTNLDLSKLMADIFKHPNSYYSYENKNTTKSGEHVWIAWNNRLISHSDEDYTEILCVGTDITARKNTEEALKESERKYRFLFEDSPAGGLILGTDGLLKNVNKSFLGSLGYTLDDLIGKRAIDFVIPEQKAIVAKRLASYFRNSLQPELDVGLYAKNGAIHFTRFSGKASAIYENNTLTGILLTGVDITKRKEIEEVNKNQQEKLVQADKMATLGILVSGVAHEINNPNNFILLNSTNLLDIWNDLLPILDNYILNNGLFHISGLPFSEIRDDIKPLIKGISDGAERIQRIVHSLKDFSRKDSGMLDQIFCINSVIDTSIIIMNNLIRKSTNQFTISLDKDLPDIRGNFQQIEQVIINLVTNACQALTDKNQGIFLSTRKIHDKGGIMIEIVDQGKGIAPKHRKHILDPFFTTKRDCGGTGLGLSISYNIIKDHKGEITFESKQNKGTSFKIILPAI